MRETQSQSGSKGTFWDRITSLGWRLSILVLVFLLGILVSLNQWPPYQWVRDGLLAARALMVQQEMLDADLAPHLWYPSVHEEQGLVRHDPSRAFPGYTLYSSGHGAVAVLLDMEGHEVHRWEVPFHKVWPRAGHVSGWVPDQAIFIRRTQVDREGNLLALYVTTVNTPHGCGLAKLDGDGQVIWTYDANAHHDFSVGDDGTIVTLTEHIRRSALAGWGHLDLPVVEEFVAILTPQGREEKTFSLFDLLQKSPYYRPRLTRSDTKGDVLHSNTIHVVTEAFAKHHEGVSAGDLMVCLRNINLVIVINPEREKIVWGTTGPWHLPHDPDPLDNGRIMVFDNCFTRAQLVGSRVIEFNPEDGAIDWMYTSSDRSTFRSDVRSCSQLLPNGNVLITESSRGRIFEVTRDGEVVWEYVNPIRAGEKEDMIPIVCGAIRYRVDELPFLKQ